MKLGSSAGVTLVETLIALFALALLMSAGGAALVSTLNNQRILSERGERLRSLDLTAALLRNDIAASVNRPVSAPDDFRGPRSLVGGPPDLNGVFLQVVRNGWENPNGVFQRGGLQRVVYRFDDGQIIRTAALRADATRATPVDERIILTDVQAVEIAFIREEVRFESWDVGVAPGAGPEAVELTFFMETGGSLRQTFLMGGRS